MQVVKNIEPEINLVKEYSKDTGTVFTKQDELKTVEDFAIWVFCKHIPLPKDENETLFMVVKNYRTSKRRTVLHKDEPIEIANKLLSCYKNNEHYTYSVLRQPYVKAESQTKC